MTRYIAMWAGIFALHVSLQFVFWTLADAPTAGPVLRGAAGLWMFPLFTLGERVANRWFWSILLANSALWASIIVVIARKYMSRRAATRQ